MSPNIDRLMAWAQIGFSVLIFVFVAAVFLIFETGRAHLDADMLKIFERDQDWLKDAAFLVLVFWFQRARQGGIPDAGQTVVEHTLPDGTKTVTKTPAGQAVPPTQPTAANPSEKTP